MARWRQEIDDVDSRKEHVMDAGAPTSGGGSSGGDGGSRNTSAEQRTNHAASSTGNPEQRTSHPELVSGSNSGLGSTTPRVSAPAGRDSSSAAPRFVVVPGGARSADVEVEMPAFLRSIVEGGQRLVLSLGDTLYTLEDVTVNSQGTTAVTLMALGGSIASQSSLSTVSVGVGSGGTAGMMGSAGMSLAAEELFALGAAGAEFVGAAGVGGMVYLSYKDAQWKSQEITRLAAVKDCGKASTASDRMRAFALVPYDDSPSEYTRDILARKFACEASTDFVDSLNAAPTPTSRAPSNTTIGAPFRPSDESDFGRFYMQYLWQNPSAAADPAHLGPQILSTPMPENEVPQLITTPLPEFAKPTILGTPDDRDRLAGLFDQPGYEPTDIGRDTLQESFPIHDHDWKDSVLLKDYEVKPEQETPQSRKCEKAESEVWKSFDNHKTINGKQTKTNGLKGKDTRYYQWDDWHKEIEVYDRNGKPLEVLDPVKGERIPKSLRKHSKIEV